MKRQKRLIYRSYSIVDIHLTYPIPPFPPPPQQYYNPMTDKLQSHILSRYQLIKKNGQGAYGHVWKAIDLRTKKIVAIKKIFDAFQHSTDAQRTYRQIMFLQQFDHQNIIKLYDVIRAENDKDIYLVFEQMEVELHRLIREDILKEHHRRYVLYQVAKAIKYLHSAELIHRDLKPANVLVNSDCSAKLCDFGLVRSVDRGFCEEDDVVMTEYVATRWYRAPEILVGSPSYSKAIDIWSLGCMIAEMYKGKPLFDGTSTVDQLERILGWTGMPKKSDIDSLQSESSLSIFESMSKIRLKDNRSNFKCEDKLALDLINKMLQFNPNKRITIEQALQHPYFEDFHDVKKEPRCDRIISIPISDNKRLSVKEYMALIYKEIDRRNILTQCPNQNSRYQPHHLKPLSKSSIKKTNKSSLKESNVKHPNNKTVVSKTLYIKNNSNYISPSKLDCFDPNIHNKKFGTTKTKLSTQPKEEYSSSYKSKVRSMYSSKKNSLKTQGELYERVPSSSMEAKLKKAKGSSSISKRVNQLLNKFVYKPYVQKG